MTAARVVSRRSEDGAFAAFFARERQRAVSLAWMLTGSSAAAEDVAQDAMLAVYDRFAELRVPEAFLSQAVVNGCRNFHRRRRRDGRLLDALIGSALRGSVQPTTGEQYLLDAIQTLPYRQRVVIVGKYWADWSEKSIAEVLGCRPGTVKSLTSRALDRLRKDVDHA